MAQGKRATGRAEATRRAEGQRRRKRRQERPPPWVNDIQHPASFFSFGFASNAFGANPKEKRGDQASAVTQGGPLPSDPQSRSAVAGRGWRSGWGSRRKRWAERGRGWRDGWRRLQRGGRLALSRPNPAASRRGPESASQSAPSASASQTELPPSAGSAQSRRAPTSAPSGP